MLVDVSQDRDGEWITEVVLSRRNVLSLLAKLDGYPAGSAATLISSDDQPTVIVHAEEDKLHYAKMGRAPGPMHPTTEQAIGWRGGGRDEERS